jgi:hypothetical protein
MKSTQSEPSGRTGRTGRGEPAEPADKLDPVAYDLVLQAAGNNHPYPWRGLNPKDVRKIEGTIRMNAYEKALLHYVAGVQQTSVSKLLLGYVREAALAEVRGREG